MPDLPVAAPAPCLCAERGLLGTHEKPCAGFGARSDELCEQAEREAVAAGEWPKRPGLPVAAPDHAAIREAIGTALLIRDRVDRKREFDALLAERQQDKERIERLETALENADEELGRAPAMAVPHLVESFKRQLLLVQRIIRAALAVEEDARPGKPETPGNSGAICEVAANTATRTIELRLVPDLSPDGFLRKCYDEWVADADWYRAHPEEDCPADYLAVVPFEQYVEEITRERVAEIGQMFTHEDGFTIEVVPA